MRKFTYNAGEEEWTSPENVGSSDVPRQVTEQNQIRSLGKRSDVVLVLLVAQVWRTRFAEYQAGIRASNCVSCVCKVDDTECPEQRGPSVRALVRIQPSNVLSFAISQFNLTMAYRFIDITVVVFLIIIAIFGLISCTIPEWSRRERDVDLKGDVIGVLGEGGATLPRGTLRKENFRMHMDQGRTSVALADV